MFASATARVRAARRVIHRFLQGVSFHSAVVAAWAGATGHRMDRHPELFDVNAHATRRTHSTVRGAARGSLQTRQTVRGPHATCRTPRAAEGRVIPCAARPSGSCRRGVRQFLDESTSAAATTCDVLREVVQDLRTGGVVPGRRTTSSSGRSAIWGAVHRSPRPRRPPMTVARLLQIDRVIHSHRTYDILGAVDQQQITVGIDGRDVPVGKKPSASSCRRPRTP
jgi:hypothetical protein